MVARHDALQFGKFQFHEGPIKTRAGFVPGIVAWLFQFHEGPIKTRLWPPSPRSLGSFQFHEGPIKTSASGKYAQAKFSFNSMKVRLKRCFLA